MRRNRSSASAVLFIQRRAFIESLEARQLFSGGVAGVPLVTVDTVGGAQNAAVAMTPTDGYVVAWTDTMGTDGNGDGVMARIYDANGNPSGPAFVANANTTGNQLDPAVAVAPNGTIAITWTDTNLNQVSARLFTSTGTPINSTDVQITTGGFAGSDAQAAVFAKADGSFELGWAAPSPYSGFDSLVIQHYSAALSALNSPFVGSSGNPAGARNYFDSSGSGLYFETEEFVSTSTGLSAYAAVSGTQINVTRGYGLASFTTNVNSLTDGPSGYVPVALNVDASAAVAWIDAATGNVELQPLPFTAVTVDSITRATFRTASANSVQWTATFSQPIAMLTSSNFQLTSAGLTQNPAILSVAAVSPTGGFADQWTITASTGAGAGVLGLNLVNGAGLFPGFTIANTLAGQVYAFNTTPTSTTTFSQVSIPSVAFGAAQDMLSGSLVGTNLAPTGSVTATLGGSLVSGTIDANGGFSIPINTASLTPGIYLVDVSYGGDGVSSTAATALTLDVGAAPAAFSGLSSPSLVVGAASTSLGGTISGGSTGMVPSGAVMITLDGVTQLAAISPDGSFASAFNTAALPAGSYAVRYSYVGDTHFDPVIGSTIAAVQYATSSRTSAAKLLRKRAAVALF